MFNPKIKPVSVKWCWVRALKKLKGRIMLAQGKKIVNLKFSEVYNQFISPQHDPVSFLKSLYEHREEGFINIRFLPSAKNLFIPLSEIDSTSTILESHKNENIYFGVSTRVKGDGTKAGIRQIPALWIDIDFKDLTEGKIEVQKRIRDFPLKPTFVINSGGGLHIYFKFKEPDTRDEIPRVENLNRRLASYFGGDMASTDASRILRLPGSRNFKYEPARDVTIETFHPEREFNLSDFDFLPELKEDRPLGLATLPQLSDNHTDGEALLEEALKVACPGIRNSTGFQLACKLRDLGLTKDEAFPFMIRYAKGKHGKEGDHRYTRKEALSSLYQAYNGKKGTPVLSLPIRNVIETLWGKKGQPKHTCKKLRSKTDLLIDRNTGSSWFQTYYEDEWDCPGCAWYAGKVIASDLGFNFRKGFYYMLIPLQDRKRSEMVETRIVRTQGGGGCGLVSFAEGVILLASNVSVDEEMRFVTWEDTSMIDILSRFLSCEPKPLNRKKKIRPFGTFLRARRNKAEEGTFDVIRIDAPPENTTESLRALGSTVDDYPDVRGRTFVKLSPLAQKFFRSIVTGDTSKLFPLNLPFDNPIWRARVLKKRKLE
jgi:hypothetical protein